ncbi:hypothetical protein [Faecalibaculum rodentium]|uniref:hypothetical protein n=1 Tax=Faecalibaculum rodentium TaxID=1702221 RepID=UPI003F67C77B
MIHCENGFEADDVYEEWLYTLGNATHVQKPTLMRTFMATKWDYYNQRRSHQDRATTQIRSQ